MRTKKEISYVTDLYEDKEAGIYVIDFPDFKQISSLGETSDSKLAGADTLMLYTRWLVEIWQR